MFIIAFFVLCASNSALSVALRDTIIIDGFTIVVEKQVVYDTIYKAPIDTVIPPPIVEPPKKFKKRIFWSYGLEFVPGVRIGNVRSGVTNYLSVGDVIDKQSPVSNAMELGSWISRPVAKHWSIRGGLSVLNSNVSFSNFKEEALHDSLWRFYVPESGSLSQITRFDYGVLGAELDTLPVPLIRSSIREWAVQIPLQAVLDFKDNPKRSYWSIHGGFNLRYRRATANAPAALIADLTNPAFLSINQLTQTKMDASALFGAKYIRVVKRGRWFSAGMQVTSPLGYDFMSGNLVNRHLLVCLTMGYIFSR